MLCWHLDLDGGLDETHPFDAAGMLQRRNTGGGLWGKDPVKDVGKGMRGTVVSVTGSKHAMCVLVLS